MDKVERFYGRRKGRPLRLAQKARVEDLLPQLSINLGEAFSFERLFSTPKQELWLEIGFGAGEHLAGIAAQYPKVGLIGCEPFINGVARLLKSVDDHKLDNIRLYGDDARPVLDWLPAGSVTRVYVLFPDPWPKKRHHNRRFIHPHNLKRLARVLALGGELHVATDHMDYACWVLYHMGRSPDFMWQVSGAKDWRQPFEDHIETRYEAKAHEASRSCAYFRFLRV